MSSLQTKRLGGLQARLQRGRLWWFGNRLSDLRYYLWRLTGGSR